MRSASLVAWGFLCAALVLAGCARRARERTEAAHEAEAAGTRLLPTGRDDGIKATELIRGKVKAVDKMLGLVVLDVGERHGVKPRYGFTVYRGDKYVGRIVVDEAFPDLSSARYGRTMKLHVNVGDDVTTKLAVEP